MPHRNGCIQLLPPVNITSELTYQKMKISSNQVTQLQKSAQNSFCGDHECEISSESLCSGLEQPLRMAVQAAYISCVSPFTVSKNVRKGQPICFEVRRKWWQMSVCIFLTIFGSFWLISEISKSIPKDTRNPALYFKMISSILDTALKVVTMKQLWYNQKEFADIINFAAERGHINSSTRARFLKFIATFVILFYLGKGILFWILGPGGGFAPLRFTEAEIHSQRDLSIFAWWHQMVEMGKHIFFLEQNPQNSSLYSWQVKEVVVGGLAAAGYFQRRMIGAFTDLFIIMGVLTLQSAAKNFTEALKFQGVPVTEWRSIRDEYRMLRKLSWKINSLLGGNITSMILITILIGATSLHEIFVPPRGTTVFDMGVLIGFVVNSYVVLSCCTDITRRVSQCFLLYFT